MTRTWAERLRTTRARRVWLAEQGAAVPADASDHDVHEAFHALQHALVEAEHDEALRKRHERGAKSLEPDELEWSPNVERDFRRLVPCAETGLDCAGSPHTARCRDRRRNQRERAAR